MLQPSERCKGSLVKRFEDGAGWAAGVCSRLKAYRCPAGVWTIGYGHTDGVEEGQTITDAEAEKLLAADLEAEAGQLEALLPATVADGLTQGQVDALASLALNLRGGARAIPRRAPRLWAAVLGGNKQAAAAQFLDMDRAVVKGVAVELGGLKTRRAAEAAVYLS